MIELSQSGSTMASVLSRHFLRLIKGPGTLESTASKIDVLCNEETESARPTIMLPNQLDRVTGASAFSTVRGEIDQLTRQIAVHAATKAFHLSNAAIIGGSVYCNNLKFPISDTPCRTRLRRIKQAAITSSFVGCRYFAHWLFDDCALHLLAEKYGEVLNLPRRLYSHESDYAQLFGQDWSSPTNHAIIDNLVIFDDYGENSNKRRRQHTLRERAKRSFSPWIRSIVYLRRGSSGQLRLVANEEEIIRSLPDVDVVDVQTDNVATIVNKIAGSKLVVSIEGSHASHCAIALPQGASFLVLEPCDRLSAHHRGWANSIGVKLGMVIGSKTERGYHFDPIEIRKTMDLLTATD